MFSKTKNDTDYTEIVVSVYQLLANKYKYTIRITLFWQLLKDCFAMSEDFAIFDPLQVQNGSFDSYLLDLLIDWKNNKPVDFNELYKSLLIAGDFTGGEKLMFKSGNIEERLWAMFLAIDNPQQNLIIKK